MKKLALALAAIFALGIAAGCSSVPAQPSDTGSQQQSPTGDGKEDDVHKDDETSKGDEGSEEQTPPATEREKRVLPADFKYKVVESEYTVKYDGITLYGRLYLPDDDGKFPAVILSHGFNGHYTDFPTECKRFAERGYICYAFDFCGAQSGGKSTGRTSTEYTPFTMKQDLLAVVDKIGRDSQVDASQIFLFGGSQGGFVTAITAADAAIRDKIAGVALYFPTFNIPDDWHGKPEVDTPLMGYTIGAEFIKSIQTYDPFSEIGAYKGDVCIVWGDKDNLVARKYIDDAVKAYGEDRTSLTVLPGAGHGFGGADLQKAVETVLAFLEAHTYEC